MAPSSEYRLRQASKFKHQAQTCLRYSYKAVREACKLKRQAQKAFDKADKILEDAKESKRKAAKAYDACKRWEQVCGKWVMNTWQVASKTEPVTRRCERISGLTIADKGKGKGKAYQ